MILKLKLKLKLKKENDLDKQLLKKKIELGKQQ